MHSCGLPDSASRGVVFRLRISPRIRCQNRNGSKCSVRDLCRNDLCKHPRKSASLPCPFNAFALSETDNLIGQEEEKLGKKLSKLADKDFFSRSHAIHRMHYNLSIVAVSQKYRQQTQQGNFRRRRGCVRNPRNKAPYFSIRFWPLT
jgi:hypothetical protein